MLLLLLQITKLLLDIRAWDIVYTIKPGVKLPLA
jgi:hypothetical protein